MPTVFTHPVVPLAIGLGLGRKLVPAPLLVCGVIGSVLPDLDVIAFRIGIPYAAEFGHRGFSHSLLFAFVVALLFACFYRFLQTSFLRALLFLFIAVSSHGVLDTLTNGGLGIALLWPWSEHRYFMPLHPIEVSPLGMSRFLSERGLVVLKSEFLWVWLPAMAATSTMILARLALTLQSIGQPKAERFSPNGPFRAVAGYLDIMRLYKRRQ
jgi:inner membrane protein